MKSRSLRHAGGAKWTSRALADLVGLHDFLASANNQAAASVVRSLVAAGARLNEDPRIGKKLEEFEPREVRRILVGNCEVRYEIENTTISLLRPWQTREER
ncbi:plasmid stabilization protein [Mesorhizobium sp. LNHC229A00]|nr:plasmid stabilization protein [Mesorhizobium sp. LNHC229A00]